jgi:general secretion pathway protein B
MSYILEALKKAEQARNRGKAPELFTVQATEAALPERSNPWPYIIIAVIAVNAAVLLTWLRPWQRHAPVAPSQMASTTIDRRPAQEQVAAAPTPAPVPPGEPLIPQEGVQSAAPRPVESKPSASVPRSTPTTSARTVTSPKAPQPKASAKAPGSPAARESAAKGGNSPKVAAQSPPDSSAPASSIDAESSESGVIAFNELPASIRQELGGMTVAVHMYSAKPADRFVSINDRPLHEGDEINPGLTLDKITYDGMILSYKGYRFKKGIN